VRSLRAFAVALAIVMAGSGALAGPALGSARSSSALDLLFGALNAFPGLRSVASAVIGNNIDLGKDGRLTIMVVGSDYRYTRHIGERLDAVIVATINPTTKQIAAVSIPRDTGNLPLPDPGDTYHGKVNSLYAHYRKITGSRNAALEKFRQAIAKTLNVEIDYLVFTRFPGFDALVDAVGGVNVDIAAEIRDPTIIDALGKPRGARFVVGNNVLEQGASATQCYGTPAPITDWSQVPVCHHALIYMRSRHGKVGTAANSDWKRDGRQQSFLYAAVRRVLANGNGSALTGLSSTARSMPNDIYTTLPISDPGDLLALYDLFDGAQNVPLETAVLKPTKYAYKVAGTRRYELRLDVVRALTAQWFAPVP
jgi:LCP family protein required for cell wall assembly